MILTQQKLIKHLQQQGIHVCSTTVHAWVRSGCPIVPGWKRPKFILAQVLDWLQSGHKADPLEQDVRDRLYKRSLRRSA